MFWHKIHKYVVFTALAVAGSFAAERLYANSIAAVSVEPTFECAGVVVTLAGSDDPGAVTLEVRGPGETQYRPAHFFTRYDNYHMASSLFNLAPGTAYDIRVTRGGQAVTGRVTTRPEFALPPPVRTVPVADSAQLRAALGDARPGDEILLAAGTYDGGLVIASSGTADHPIVIRGAVSADAKAQPVDRRTGLPVIDGAGQSPVISVRGSYVVLDSLRLEHVRVLGISLDAVRNCVIQGCQVTGTSGDWNHFIYVNGGGRNGGRHLIQENYLLDDNGAGVGYGILQDNKPGPGTVIRRNILSGFYDGINPSGNEGELNDDNLPETHPDVLGTWPNQSTDVYENTIRVSRDDDLEVDGIAVNMRIFRNALSVGAGNHVTNGISIAPVAPGPFFFIGNVIANFYEGAVKYNTASYRGTIRNCYFYHNTIKNDEGVERRGTLLTLWEGDGLPGTPSKNTQYKNNIFVGDRMLVQRLMDIHTPQYNPNYWYSKQASGTLYQWGKNGPYYNTFDAWRQGTGEEAQGYYGDPKVDAAFHLSPGSPAIDKGVLIPGVNDRYAGSAPDMGAYEYGMPSAPVGSPAADGATDPSTPAPCVISGYVRDSAAAPLPGVLITLSGAAAGTAVSDANGFYRFTGLPQGSYRVTASRDGYVFSPGAGTVALAAAAASQDFAAAGPEAPPTLADAVCYPNPWKADNPSGVRFRNLTLRTRIAIYALDGALVKEINEPDRTEAEWDVAGDNVGSGVYFCVMSNDKGERKTQKIAIIR